MGRLSILAAALVVSSLPGIAAAQTPSVTPTPAPIALTFQFDCARVPWSCGDGPNDVRWQLYEIVGCHDSGQEGCRYQRVGPVLPRQTVILLVGHRYKLFLAANLDRSDRVSRACPVTSNIGGAYLGLHSSCAINGDACAGPQNWQIYFRTDTRLVQVFKHIGDCSSHLPYRATFGWVIAWGLPGELATPAAVATMTAPPGTATSGPTATVTMEPTADPLRTATMALPAASPATPTASAWPTETGKAVSTVTPASAVTLTPTELWLPMLSVGAR